MIKNLLHSRYSICALMFVIVIGSVLCLPSQTGSQILEYQAKTGSQRELVNASDNGKRRVISSTEDFQYFSGLDNFPEAGTRYYVAKSGDGSNGKSWKYAFTNLQDALAAAVNGDEIWVAAGIYNPGSNREDSFNLVPGVKVYGGFKPGDNKLSDRDWEDNLTILSGDIDGNDFVDGDGIVVDYGDILGSNSFHVVKADGTTGTPITSSTILDGFIITAGKAEGVNLLDKFGGGFFCNGMQSGNECSPSLNNITFSGNLAKIDGGAMVNYGHSEGISSPTLRYVMFSGNKAVNGGALFNYAPNNGKSNPSLREVTFTGNSADYGGAMYNQGSTGISSPDLTDVDFIDNSAYYDGGAMFNDGHADGISSPSLRQVAFAGNSAVEKGGAIYNNGESGSSSPNLRDVNFSKNSAGNGGAMYNYGYKGSSSPGLKNVVFTGNSADGNGGAVYNDGLNGGNNPLFTNVKFSGNKAGNIGGAVFNDGRSGGVSITGMYNVTFSGNFAVIRGGGIYNFGGTGTCKVELYNSILWNNQDSSGPGTLNATIRNDTATTTVFHSLVQGTGGSMYWTSDTSFVNGMGNIDENPKFIIPVDPITAPTTDGDLHLKRSSPAVDAGENSYVSFSFDLDNQARITDGDGDSDEVVDMGAYEVPDYFPYRLYGPLILR